MSFLAPLFLLGALAVAFPIVFHLIRRTTRERRPFSSLMFLMPTPPKVTRRSRLENLWLLLLRCLVLGLLAFGFARPFLKKPLQAEPSGMASKQVIVLIDSSASMRRANLWPEARDRAAEVLSELSPADQAGVWAFDSQVRPIFRPEEWSAAPPGGRLATVRTRLAAMEPDWGATDLGNALIEAAEALEEAATAAEASPTAARQIVVISDFQTGSERTGLQGYEWPSGIEVRLEPVKARRPTNAGLQLVADSEGDGGVRGRVSNSADARSEQFRVGWTQPNVPGFVGDAVEIYVPPGQSRVLKAPSPGSGEDAGQLRLAGDEEDFDNMAYYVSPGTNVVTILYLGNEPEDDPEQPLFYLKRAFQQTRRQDVKVEAIRAETALMPERAARAPLIVVGSSLPETRIEWVREALGAGKTVLVMMRERAMAATVAGLGGGGLVEAEERSAGDYAMLGHIDFSHPLFAPFADPRYSDFTKIHFWKYRRMAAERLPGARVLARFDSHDPALLEIPRGNGVLLVLTSGWHPADSQFALSSKFVPLLYSILSRSGGMDNRKFQYTVGDEILLAATNRAGESLRVRKPDGTEATTSGSRFTQADQPGIYTVMSMSPPLWFAVNLHPEESNTAPMPLEELERLGVPLKREAPGTAAAAAAKRVRLQAAELENRQKLWRWMLLAALLALLAETWLAGRIARRAGRSSAPEATG